MAYGSNSTITWAKDGWQLASNGKRYIHKYYHSSKTYDDISDGITTMSWAAAGIWSGQDYVIIFKNKKDVPMRIKKVKVKMVSCNSGGKTFYAMAGGIRLTGPASGNGAKYQIIVRVFKNHAALKSNSNPQSEKSKQYTMANNTTSNMVSRGSTTSTAKFKFDESADIRTVDFGDDCPVIKKNGVAAIHVRATEFTSPSSNTFIKFDLDSTILEIEEEDRPYIWQYQSDGKWHLIKPAYIKTESNGFKPLEEVKKLT